MHVDLISSAAATQSFLGVGVMRLVEGRVYMSNLNTIWCLNLIKGGHHPHRWTDAATRPAWISPAFIELLHPDHQTVKIET